MTKFTEAETDRIISFLKEKCGEAVCSMCKSGEWILENSCFKLMNYNSGDIWLEGPIIPVIPLACKNCSNTVLINAILVGVVSPNDKPSDENVELKVNK